MNTPEPVLIDGRWRFFSWESGVRWNTTYRQALVEPEVFRKLTGDGSYTTREEAMADLASAMAHG